MIIAIATLPITEQVTCEWYRARLTAARKKTRADAAADEIEAHGEFRWTTRKHTMTHTGY